MPAHRKDDSGQEEPNLDVDEALAEAERARKQRARQAIEERLATRRQRRKLMRGPEEERTR